MAHNKEKKKAKVKDAEKDDLYHDIEQEKKKKLERRGIREVAYESGD